MKLGIDLWRVILSAKQPNLFYPRIYESGAIDSISKLCQTLGPNNIHIVSAIKEDHLRFHYEALTEDCFFEKTGMKKNNLHFVFDAKNQSCKFETVNSLGITHFVDDQPLILKSLPPGIKRYWYDPEIEKVPLILTRVVYDVPAYQYPHFYDWGELLDELLKESRE